jgi:hypothetical protein
VRVFRSPHITDKWLKTAALRQNPALKSRIPQTRKFTRANLSHMLHQYRMLYIKPRRGAKGIGVMRAEFDMVRGRKHYRLLTNRQSRTYRRFSSFYAAIRKAARRPYLLQKGIRLLTRHEHPFDFRVMVQKNARNRWEATGIVGRVAPPGNIVTNGSQGGRSFPAETLLKPYAGKKRTRKLLRRLRRLGVQSAEQMEKRFSGLKEIGLDVGLDRHLVPWIIEVNTRPDPKPFAKLKNKEMILRIIRLAKRYGRSYKL